METKSFTQKVITCLDGKERLVTFSSNGRIRYKNMKDGEEYGTSYGLNTTDFPVVEREGSIYRYKKALPKWITKEMIIEAKREA